MLKRADELSGVELERVFTKKNHTGLMLDHPDQAVMPSSYYSCEGEADLEGKYSQCAQRTPALQVQGHVTSERCDRVAASVTMRPGTFLGAFTQTNSLHLYKALWALPTEVYFIM